MLVKVSFLVVASFSAFAVSQINKKPTKIQDGTFLESKKVEKDEEEPEASNIQDEGKKEAKMFRSNMSRAAKDTEMLSVLTWDLEKRKVSLEWKLLELHGLKEEKAYKAQLHGHLKEKSAEIDMLNITLGSLQIEKKSLKEEIKQSFLVKKTLEMAKKTVAEMQRKIDVIEERNVKGKILLIEEKICGIQEDENPERDALIEEKLKAANNVGLEVVKLKRRNKELELEKRELVVTLLAAQAKITSLSHMTEGKIMSKVEDEISTLRCGNEELSKQIERFQKDRFTMVEELVYQRWLHSCLRFEIQNKENPRRETSEISLKNDPFQNFDEKNKSPSSYPSSSYNISSNISSSTETDQVESTTIGSSSSSQNSISSKTPNFMQRIKNFGRCKDDSSVAALLAGKREKSKSRTGLIRRFSTSMVLVNSSPKLSCPRVRRVSFSDSVMTHNMPSSVESVLDQSASDENSSHNLSIGFKGKENSEEIKPDASLVSGGDSKENKDEDHMAYLFVVLFFFLFIFLAYLLQITTRCHKT